MQWDKLRTIRSETHKWIDSESWSSAIHANGRWKSMYWPGSIHGGLINTRWTSTYRIVSIRGVWLNHVSPWFDAQSAIYMVYVCPRIDPVRSAECYVSNWILRFFPIKTSPCSSKTDKNWLRYVNNNSLDPIDILYMWLDHNTIISWFTITHIDLAQHVVRQVNDTTNESKWMTYQLRRAPRIDPVWSAATTRSILVHMREWPRISITAHLEGVGEVGPVDWVLMGVITMADVQADAIQMFCLGFR